MRCTAPLLLVSVSFLAAGCADPSAQDGLADRYGEGLRHYRDLLPAGVGDVALIEGQHLVGRFGDGEWQELLAHESTQTFAGPAGTPSANGGSGERTDLALAPLSFEVRLEDPSGLDGFEVGWLRAGKLPQPSAQMPFEAVLPPGQAHVASAEPGANTLFAVLLRAGRGPDELPQAVFAAPFAATRTVLYEITGEVQPWDPGSASTGIPFQDRDLMVDRYVLPLPAGTLVEMETRHNGLPMAPGYDVDIGVYYDASEPYVCAAGSRPSPGFGPNEAAERLQVRTDRAGLWSMEVGAMQSGCPDQRPDAPGRDFAYSEEAPVPYALALRFG